MPVLYGSNRRAARTRKTFGSPRRPGSGAGAAALWQAYGWTIRGARWDAANTTARSVLKWPHGGIPVLDDGSR
jgi:hypothetical protein